MCLQWLYVFSIFDFPQHYQCFFFQNKIVVQKTFPASGFVSIVYTTDNVEHVEYHIILFCRDLWKGLIVQCKEDEIYATFVFRHFVSF